MNVGPTCCTEKLYWRAAKVCCVDQYGAPPMYESWREDQYGALPRDGSRKAYVAMTAAK
jgi:hypothetical protein